MLKKNLMGFITKPLTIGRYQLLKFLRNYLTFLPDKIYIKIVFRLEMGYPLNLKNPRTFQEKMQWLKLYNRKPEYTKMVDKAAVKDFVARTIGSEYIIPTLGIWNKFDDIDFRMLPDKFVLKTTHSGGGGGVIICRDKDTFNINEAKKTLEGSLKCDLYNQFREWPYKDVPRMIIAERLLEIPNKDDLTDYKIYCFNGEPYYIQVIQDRNTSETIDFFDLNWNHQEFCGLNENISQSKNPISRPSKLKDMITIARKLSKGTVFIRVDLYFIEDKIYFGELTFYPAAGMGSFRPNIWNLRMGNLIKLQKIPSTKY